MMFELYLMHGREAVDEELSDWGDNGHRLQDVIGLHQTYGTPSRVIFANAEAAAVAEKLTGWKRWDDDTLAMTWADDMVVALDEDGKKMFYGDWGLFLKAQS